MARKTVEEKVAEIQKVVMYSRIGFSVSSEEDEQRFLQQEDAMQKFCDDNNLEVKSKYREIAVGTLDHWSRPVLEKVFDDLKWSKKEKSVILVSRIDRLSKSFSVALKMFSDYNPKFLVAARGLRCDQFLHTMQIACAEEEFRVKYGKLFHTSEAGYQTFYNRCKLLTRLMLEDGTTAEELADYNSEAAIPLPYNLMWDASTIENIMKYGVEK